MAELTRDEQLVRASTARAAITGFLSRQVPGVPITQDIIAPAIEDVGYTPQELGAMLYRMAADGLIGKAPAEHPRYHVGYMSTERLDQSEEGAEPTRRKYTRKAATEGAPIDVRVNEREGIITIRYAGMVLSFSKE